jgi:hypothetical protein
MFHVEHPHQNRGTVGTFHVEQLTHTYDFSRSLAPRFLVPTAASRKAENFGQKKAPRPEAKGLVWVLGYLGIKPVT